VPEDRKEVGLFENLNIEKNLGIVWLLIHSRFGLLGRRLLRDLVNDMQARLQIKLSTPDDPIGTLSGGNQQKVLIARWLAIDPKLLVMNEPTRGVDIGAKDEITRLIRRLAGEGCSFVIASSEFDELCEIADRILVMNGGRIVAELAREEVTKQKLIHATGIASTSPAPTP
jgi:ribose transport system ATP-binding protein